ncbi:c-type heme family protein [Nitratidesulfovibrio sp. 1201_IL3209]|uniref:c-type heme family protein n=1 Tax=Nitratidesulfovibrio sp. 1201_IL3209 TaxID=3084053 RepID=UPI002FD8E5DB
MFRLTPHSLQARFLLGLLLILACLGGFFALSLFMHLERLVENEARDRAALILAQAEAVQSYVRNTLRPAMYSSLPGDTFVIEAMSTSFVTRAVMNDNNLAHDRFTYRRVAVGARNPAYEASEFERGIIARFRDDPELTRVEDVSEEDGERLFITAKPVRFETACLRCHGDPEQAPPVLLSMYGAERGFWRKTGDLAGMTMVALPMDQAVSGMTEAVVSFGVLFAGGALALFAVIHVFFNRLVVHNLRRMGGVMRRHFPDEADMTMPRRGHPDVGIDDLLGDMESLARHLSEARAKLRDYAANLEGMVHERTVDLATEATARRTDVELFVGLLDRLNRSSGKGELLAASLALVARRFGADRAAYACVLSASDFHAWPDRAVRPELPPDWHDLAAEGAPRLTPRAWFIPVQTSDTTRGLLCLYWDADHASGPGTADLAQAVGRQLGIAMDNLDALDNLLRQNALLDSIFEGISDPLLLLGGDGRVVLANSSALQLTRSLTRSLATSSDSGRDGAQGRGNGDGGDGGDENAAGTDGAALAELLDAADIAARMGDGPVSRAVTLRDGRSFAVNAYPLGGRLERGGRTVAYLRETTDERRMLERVQQHEKLVAVGKLAAGLAHEINNPLGVIHCYADLLRAAAPDGQAQADIDVIMRHTEQARKVVRDLLDFARPKQAERGPCDVAEVLSGLADVFRPRARAARARIVPDLPDLPDLPDTPGTPGGTAGGGNECAPLPPVLADRSGLEQILTNLLLNALDAVETDAPTLRDGPDGDDAETRSCRPDTAGGTDGKGGKDGKDSGNGADDGDGADANAPPAFPRPRRRGVVVLSARSLPDPHGQDEVVVHVIDNGPGIPEEHLPRLFDPFFTTKAAGRGTGLGLAVVFGIMRDMGGRIEARNLTPADLAPAAQGGLACRVDLAALFAESSPSAQSAGSAGFGQSAGSAGSGPHASGFPAEPARGAVFTLHLPAADRGHPAAPTEHDA